MEGLLIYCIVTWVNGPFVPYLYTLYLSVSLKWSQNCTHLTGLWEGLKEVRQVL